MKHPPRVPLCYGPWYSIPWPEKHRFPMAKYRLLYELLRARGVAAAANTRILHPVNPKIVSLAHDFDYVERTLSGALTRDEQRTLGFDWSPSVVRRALNAVNGSIRTAELALRHRVACNLAGGTHHAHADRGAGFCLYNDLAVVARYLLHRGLVSRVLVLDCDVHQGDGTATMLAGVAGCFTCSLHGRNNYPFTKVRSDLDVELEDGCDDAGYLEVLATTLERLDTLFTPEIVLYDGGSDVHRDDRLGRLGLTDDGIVARDRMVLEWFSARGIPVACYIGGGYDHNHQRLARRHALLIETADAIYRSLHAGRCFT